MIAPIDYRNAVNELLSAKEATHELKRTNNVTEVFQRVLQGVHGALKPVVQNNAEMQELHDLANARLREATHLRGTALRDAHVDVFRVFIRILHLLNKQLELEKNDRARERELQSKHMQKIADNYASQGKWLLNTAIGAGVLSILSGVAPILQHSAAGDSVYNALPKFLKSDAPKEDLFKGYGKMFYAMSEINKNAGQIHQTYSEGWRTTDHHKSEVAKMLNEDDTRNLEDERHFFNNLISALNTEIQTEKDVKQQLCR